MGKLEGAKKIGIRDKETGKIVAIYPEPIVGDDEYITKTVKDWYYMQNCSAEEELTRSYVDALTDQEIQSRL